MGSKLIPKTKKPTLQNGDKIKSIGTVEKVGTYKGDLKGMMDLPVEKRKIQEARDKATRDEYVKKEGPKKLIAKNKEGGKNWIKGAVDPKHEGFCTPMTKSTCTPRRKAFAQTMKKHHGFHKGDGGEIGDMGSTIPMSKAGGSILIPKR